MKKRYKKNVTIVFAGIIGLIFFIILIEVVLSNATSWCPLAHRLNMDMHCMVRDTIDDSVLVEHFNIDTNVLQLSIHSKSGIAWIKHPYEEAQTYIDRVSENRIKFDRKDRKRIIVNENDTLQIVIVANE